MLPQDSITHVEPTVVNNAVVTDSAEQSAKPRTPYEVLRTLPSDATPAQQDSAIQATFQPAEIHYSNQPDTLHLPGHEIGTKLTEVDIPVYYEKTFFAQSLQQSDYMRAAYGVPGDPMPYSLHKDDMLTSVLLAVFVVGVLLISGSRSFFLRQLKSFFKTPRIDDMFLPETNTELRCQFFLMVQTCLFLGILMFFYTQEFIGETFIVESDYMVVGIYTAMMAGYFLTRFLLYTLVNLVFFDKKKNMYWQKILLFLSCVEGVLLFPVIMLLIYFNLSTESVILYFTITLILVKILTIYKCFIIFFRRKGGFLQIILYFCALEIVPLAAFWSILVLTGNFLKINY